MASHLLCYQEPALSPPSTRRTLIYLKHPKTSDLPPPPLPTGSYNDVERKAFIGFLPAASPDKLTDMSRKAAAWRLHRRTTSTLDDLAREVNPVLRGWLNYFTVFYPTAVMSIGTRMDRHLMRWARRKYKRLERSDGRARAWLRGVRKRSPNLFAHWRLRYTT